MTDLAIDSSGPWLSLAVRRGELRAERAVHLGRAHSVQLPARVGELYRELGLPFWADRVILGSGPGSYTGLRVAQAYALGLASAWGGTALLGVSSLAGMVPLDRAGRWLVATDAGRGRFYSAAYAVGSGHLTCLAAEAKREEGELRQLEAELGLQLAQATFPSGLALLELAELGLGRAPPQLQYL